MDIVLFSLAPSSSMAQLNLWNFFSVDKFGHLGFYGSAAFCYLLGLKDNKHYQIIMLISLLCLGILIEYLQYAMHMGRAYELLDVAANVLGLSLAWGLYKLVDSKN